MSSLVILFQSLYCHFILSLASSWFLVDPIREKSASFNSIETFENALKIFRSRKSLKLSKSLCIMKTLKEGEANSKHWLLVVKSFEYHKSIKAISRVLFDDEIDKCGIRSIYFGKETNCVKICLNIQKEKSCYLTIEKLLKQQFSNPGGWIDHALFKFPINLSLIEKAIIKIDENILKRLLMNDIGNVLKVYSKGNDAFSNWIFLICSKENSKRKEFIHYNQNMIKGPLYIYENYSRFGIYQSGKFPLKSFIFYQFKENSNDEYDFTLKYYENENLKFVTVRPPRKTRDIPDLLKYVINLAFHYC